MGECYKLLGVLRLWRVPLLTVNQVPRGKHSRFESVDTHQFFNYLRVAQFGRALDLGSRGFVGSNPTTETNLYKNTFTVRGY